MTKTTTKPKVQDTLPEQACRFVLGDDCAVQLADDSEDGDGKKKMPFSMVANSGRPILGHWYWGNLGIDLGGVKCKGRMPVLVDHRSDQRIGYTLSVEVTSKGMQVQGELLPSSQLAQQVRGESRDGFPWQASVHLRPLKIERIPFGETAEVNGHKLVGPGTIFRSSECREVSFTALGADSQTSAAALSGVEPDEGDAATQLNEDDMTTKTEPDVKPAPNNEAALGDARSAGATAERERVSAILSAATEEQAKLANELVANGTPTAEAIIKLNQDLRQRHTELQTRVKLSGSGAPSDQPLSGGNKGEEKATQLKEVESLPDSPEKWARQFALVPDLQSEFRNVKEFVLSQLVESGVRDMAVLSEIANSKEAVLNAAVMLTASSPAAPLTLRSVRGNYFLTLAQQLGLSWHRSIASVFPTDQPSEEYPWLGAAPNLRKWDGERTVQELKNDKITIVNDEYETSIEFRRRDLRRDKTGQMMARVSDMARRVATFPDKLLTELILANGNAYDGKSYFAVDHAVGKSGTIKNLLGTGDGLTGANQPTTAQMANNLLYTLQALISFRDDQGEPLNESAREFLVMCPASLWGPTVAAITATFTSNQASNPLVELRQQGVRMTPVLNPRLTAVNQFYMFRIDAGIRPMIVQEEDTEVVEIGLDSERGKLTNRALFGHGWTGGVGYGRFELAVRGQTS